MTGADPPADLAYTSLQALALGGAAVYCGSEVERPPQRMDYRGIITIEPGKRSGKPCIRGLRITVYDVLSYLAAGMTHQQILADFPYLTEQDILACLAYAADRERRLELLVA